MHNIITYPINAKENSTSNVKRTIFMAFIVDSLYFLLLILTFDSKNNIILRKFDK